MGWVSMQSSLNTNRKIADRKLKSPKTKLFEIVKDQAPQAKRASVCTAQHTFY